MGNSFHKGPLWLQVFAPTNQGHTVWPISCLKTEISRLNESGLVCCCLVGTKTCSQSGPLWNELPIPGLHVWFLPMCLCHLSSKYVYHLSSGGIFQGFGFCILLHDLFTARLCCEDFFNQLKWKQNVQWEMFKPYVQWENDNIKTLPIK